MLLRDLRPRLDVAARDVQPRFVPAGYPRALKAAPKTTCPTRIRSANQAQTEVKIFAGRIFNLLSMSAARIVSSSRPGYTTTWAVQPAWLLFIVLVTHTNGEHFPGTQAFVTAGKKMSCACMHV